MSSGWERQGPGAIATLNEKCHIDISPTLTKHIENVTLLFKVLQKAIIEKYPFQKNPFPVTGVSSCLDMNLSVSLSQFFTKFKIFGQISLMHKIWLAFLNTGMHFICVLV